MFCNSTEAGGKITISECGQWPPGGLRHDFGPVLLTLSVAEGHFKISNQLISDTLISVERNMVISHP